MRLFPIALLAALAAPPALAETHLVKMLNGNHLGGMVYEPEFLSVSPGDSVKFLATQRGHNAASIGGFLPEGAETFLGRINEEIEISLAHEGFYGIKCSPHFDMGMVMLIRVGDAPLEGVKLPEDMPQGAKDRFAKIIARAGAAE
ncbi:pseudoazurin [Paracoccus aminovorans]|uniref:pseudoazurin n=1 Tax=Paracoccus aminovorans TaxID=34004 RepID=UPI000780EC8A|nr:pseudoazurin [Paracoccus aminovorans]